MVPAATPFVSQQPATVVMVPGVCASIGNAAAKQSATTAIGARKPGSRRDGLASPAPTGAARRLVSILVVSIANNLPKLMARNKPKNRQKKGAGLQPPPGGPRRIATCPAGLFNFKREHHSAVLLPAGRGGPEEVAGRSQRQGRLERVASIVAAREAVQHSFLPRGIQFEYHSGARGAAQKC